MSATGIIAWQWQHTYSCICACNFKLHGWWTCHGCTHESLTIHACTDVSLCIYIGASAQLPGTRKRCQGSLEQYLAPGSMLPHLCRLPDLAEPKDAGELGCCCCLSAFAAGPDDTAAAAAARASLSGCKHIIASSGEWQQICWSCLSPLSLVRLCRCKHWR